MIGRDYMPPIRYMGTKFGLRDDILRALLDTSPTPSLVVDPFCGTGAVATWLADGPSVSIGDSLSFPLAIARASVLPGANVSDELEHVVVEAALARIAIDMERHGQLVHQEAVALERSPQRLELLISSARHVGNDLDMRSQAGLDAASGVYSLARLYFSRGYYSTQQAIALDALRAAIDSHCPRNDVDVLSWVSSSARDTLLSRWLSVASALANSPGHTAQFLRGRTPSSQERVRRAWRLDAMERFRAARGRVQSRGSEHWRRGNHVRLGDAVSTLEGVEASPKVVVYADPPYTRDHYSRMYHVLETLYLYDYPDSLGVGRTRSGRVKSAFSIKNEALSAFKGLLDMSAGRGARIVISYPMSGLVSSHQLLSLMAEYGSVHAEQIPLGHSTLGGRRGRGRVPVLEGLYIVTPS